VDPGGGELDVDVELRAVRLPGRANTGRPPSSVTSACSWAKVWPSARMTTTCPAAARGCRSSAMSETMTAEGPPAEAADAGLEVRLDVRRRRGRANR
jgi:hypothetical protein